MIILLLANAYWNSVKQFTSGMKYRLVDFFIIYIKGNGHIKLAQNSVGISHQTKLTIPIRIYFRWNSSKSSALIFLDPNLQLKIWKGISNAQISNLF